MSTSTTGMNDDLQRLTLEQDALLVEARRRLAVRDRIDDKRRIAQRQAERQQCARGERPDPGRTRTRVHPVRFEQTGQSPLRRQLQRVRPLDPRGEGRDSFLTRAAVGPPPYRPLRRAYRG